MSTQAHYFKIGMFVIGTIIILVMGIIVLSAGALRRNVVMFETYIDESVQGLSVGSPVMRRGVQIGRVEEITFPAYKYDDVPREAFDKYVMVIMSINRDNFKGLSDEQIQAEVRRSVTKEGFRLKLAYQGITGIAYLDADYIDVERFPPMRVPWEPEYFYIPSTQSTLTSFTQAIDTVFQKLDHVDFERISNLLGETLVTVQEGVEDAQIPTIRDKFTTLVEELRQTNRKVLAMMDKSSSEPSVANIPDTIDQLNKTLKRVDQLISNQQADIEEISANLVKVSANLRELTEYAKRYPSQIIFGSPPARPEVVK